MQSKNCHGYTIAKRKAAWRAARLTPAGDSIHQQASPFERESGVAHLLRAASPPPGSDAVPSSQSAQHEPYGGTALVPACEHGLVDMVGMLLAGFGATSFTPSVVQPGRR